VQDVLSGKRALVSLFSTILIPALYSAYMLQRYPDAGSYSAEVFRFWGAFFLILIAASVVIKIIIYIIFSIINTITTNEEEPSIVDERDRLVELKSTRNSLYVFTVGIFIAMGSLVMGKPPSVMFILFFVAGIAVGMVGDISQFYFYRRGV
jgi:hypothetical protein